jgi:hypothetical protein
MNRDRFDAELERGNHGATLNYTAPGGINTLILGNGVAQQLSWNDACSPRLWK